MAKKTIKVPKGTYAKLEYFGDGGEVTRSIKVQYWLASNENPPCICMEGEPLTGQENTQIIFNIKDLKTLIG